MLIAVLKVQHIQKLRLSSQQFSETSMLHSLAELKFPNKQLTRGGAELSGDKGTKPQNSSSQTGK